MTLGWEKRVVRDDHDGKYQESRYGQSTNRGLLRRYGWPYLLPFGREARRRTQQQLPTTDEP